MIHIFCAWYWFWYSRFWYIYCYWCIQASLRLHRNHAKNFDIGQLHIDVMGSSIDVASQPSEGILFLQYLKLKVESLRFHQAATTMTSTTNNLIRAGRKVVLNIVVVIDMRMRRKSNLLIVVAQREHFNFLIQCIKYSRMTVKLIWD